MGAPRWTSLLAALLALGGAVGCPSASPPCVDSSRPPSSQPRIFGVSQEVALEVRATLTRECEAEQAPRQPESATVEVYDPDNQPVPATASLGLGGATVRFRPSKAGRHHLLVAFAPVGSLHQLDVLVVEDRRDATPVLSLPAGTRCTYVDRTARGTWLCGARAMREPGEPFQVLSAAASPTVAVAGDVVWALEADRVLRYVDRGTGPLELTGTAPLRASAARTPGPDPRLATPEELLLVRNEGLYRYTFTESGGITEAPLTFPRPLSGTGFMGGDSTPGLLLRAGTRLLVVGNASNASAPGPHFLACPFELDARGAYVPVPGLACQTAAGEPVGYEGDVLWVLTSDFSSGFVQETLHRYSAASGRLVAEGMLEMDGRLTSDRPPLRPGPTLPSVMAPSAPKPASMPKWNATTGLLELELTPDPGGATDLPRIGERFIWVEGLSGTGGVRVYARSSTR